MTTSAAAARRPTRGHTERIQRFFLSRSLELSLFANAATASAAAVVVVLAVTVVAAVVVVTASCATSPSPPCACFARSPCLYWFSQHALRSRLLGSTLAVQSAQKHTYTTPCVCVRACVWALGGSYGRFVALSHPQEIKVDGREVDIYFISLTPEA